jgi:oligopeptide/dipeptide ABC transporter ATP-binding protein
LTSETILEVKNLVKYFPVMEKGIIRNKQVGSVHAVDSVNFAIKRGETLGLVGESGCGKTTTARCILSLTAPTSGEIYFEGKNALEVFRSKNRTKILELRQRMQLIFQDPYASLNPRWTVANLITEAFVIHKYIPREEWTGRLAELLELVGLEDYHASRFPHEFSGGQRQRIVIARALAVNPRFLIADEPVSMLDVSVRAQILNLLKEIQKKLGVTYLYISHDLASVKHISDRVAVMYLGKIVELADVDDLFISQLHPYTKALLSAIPVPDPTTKKKRMILQGEVPSPINPPKGCRFHPRCTYAIPICREKEPELRYIGNGRLVACFREKGDI